MRLLAALAALLVLPACAIGQGTVRRAAVPALARADTAALHRRLDSLASAHRGIVGHAVHDVDTGERLKRRGDETFYTASPIRVAVLVTDHDLVEKGMTGGVDVPHETGDTNTVRSECARFPLPSRVVACALTEGNVDERHSADNEAQMMMARMGEAIVGAWPRRPAASAAQ